MPLTRATPQALCASKSSGQHSEIQMLSSEQSSLHKLVVESYIRNKTAVPSSFSTFMPKLHIMCPQVRPGGVGPGVCVRVCVRVCACVCACMRVCVCACMRV